MDSKITTRIKELLTSSQEHVKTGEAHLERQKKPTPAHILHTLGNLQACVALLSAEIAQLYHMHVGLERANLELEQYIKESHEEIIEVFNNYSSQEKETKDWKMKDSDWAEPYSREGETE